MFGKRILAYVMVAVLIIGYAPFSPVSMVAAADDGTPIYKDTSGSYTFEERAADLVAQMTLAEKASQTTGSSAPAIPRLGIPQYNWWSETIHGYSRTASIGGNAGMSYPVSYAMGATWDPDLYYKEAQEIGLEIRERSLNNYLNLTFYSPTVNLARDARWGRNDESYGEDPYLTGAMGAEFVKGVEGKDQDGKLLDTNGYYQAVTTLKHYTANNSEQNRTRGGANNVDLRALREYYTRPYRNIIKEADVQSVMTAYSSVDGVPASTSSYLMDTLLRQTWGFSGYITSDCDSVSSSAGRQKYKLNPRTGKDFTVAESFAAALAHGEDLECNGGIVDNNGTYASNMASMIGVATDKGEFTENQLDISAHRLMATRMKLGEFDEASGTTTDYRKDGAARLAAGRASGYVNGILGQTQTRLDLTEELSDSSVVMLKNSGVLPISDSVIDAGLGGDGKYNILVLGPVAKSTFLGGYTQGFSPENKVNFKTIYAGIQDAFGGNAKVEITYEEFFNYPETQFNRRTSAWDGGPGTLTTVQNQIANDDFSCISMKGEAPELVTTRPMPVSTVRAEAIAAAKAADLVIIVAGHGNGDSNEEQDRADLKMSLAQETMIKEAATANPNAILLLETYGPVEVKGFERYVKGILWSSFSGIRKTGFGRVLSGAISPSGHTTALWHKNTGVDIPAAQDYNLYPSLDTDGRTYMYYTGDVSYPFGYGLSYQTTAFTDIAVDNASVTADDEITVSFKIEEAGGIYDGKEVAQLYAVSPDAAGNDIPDKRLVGFKKVDVAKGAVTANQEITVDVSELAFFDPDAKKYKVTTGNWKFVIAKSSDFSDPQSGAQEISFEVTDGTIAPEPDVLTVTVNQEGDEAGSGAALDVRIAERLLFDKGKKIQPH
ncbi:MAG: glycoside hydrolase family 3 C-terminal domain-containing protein, partial [Clostridiales Family XIII bacterium]|nr:glycoside hydrolase family 3 C-terminal domain-containing protein [Clostridiales Family XIII bacterium]